MYCIFVCFAIEGYLLLRACPHPTTGQSPLTIIMLHDDDDDDGDEDDDDDDDDDEDDNDDDDDHQHYEAHYPPVACHH